MYLSVKWISLIKIAFADPSDATQPLLVLKMRNTKDYEVAESFLQGQRIKDATCVLGHVCLADVFITLSLSLICLLLYVFLCNSEWESGGQEGGGGMCSAELVFPDTLLSRTSGRGTFCFRTLMHQ